MTFFVLFEVFLLKLRNKGYMLHAGGLIGAHTIGFMAADTFGSLQLTSTFTANLFVNFGVVVFACICLLALVFVAAAARKKWLGNNVPEVNGAWDWTSEECEEEFVGFTMGLVLTQWFRFAIMGTMPPFHGEQVNQDVGQVVTLIFIAFGFLAAFVLWSRISQNWQGPRRKRISGIVAQTFAMTAAWSLLFSCKWSFYLLTRSKNVDVSDAMTGQITMALINTAMFLALIVVLDAAADRSRGFEKALRSSISAITLVIGLSWEGVFMTAIEMRAGDLYDDPKKRAGSVALWSFVLVLLILPTWYLHLLPKSLHAHGHGHGDGGGGHAHGEGDGEGGGHAPAAGQGEPVFAQHAVHTGAAQGAPKAKG